MKPEHLDTSQWSSGRSSGRRPFHVGVVSHSAGHAGAERFLVDTLAVLAGTDVAASVCVPSRGPMCDELERLGVPFTVVPYGWWAVKDPKALWRRAARHPVSMAAALPVAAYFAARECDLVLTNTEVVYVGALAARLLRRPHVWMLHEIAGAWRFDWGRRATAAFMHATTKRFLANSRATQDSYQELLGAPVHPIYQWVDAGPHTRGREPVNDAGAGDGRTLRCLVVGTVRPEKGQHDAIQALAALRRQGVPARLEVVGEGRPEHVDSLIRLARKIGVADLLTWRGYMPDAREAIAAADVLLVTSRSEGLGRVTVEAMLLGTPVVAAAAGATPELIRDGHTGLLYPPGNPAALATAVARLQDGALAARLARAGADWATRTFSREVFTERLVAELRAARSS